MPSTLERVNAALSAVGIVLAWALAMALDRANPDRRATRKHEGVRA